VTPDGIADDGEHGERDNVAADVGAIAGGDGSDELALERLGGRRRPREDQL
jgi:hypothetical protein